MKTVCDISLYDLMSEDFDIGLNKDKQFGFNLELVDERGEEVVRDDSIHPYAVEGLADFCKRFLRAYDRANDEGLA